jgi:HEAT repeat protein
MILKPVLAVHSVTSEILATNKVPEDALQRLGGSQRAASAIRYYLKLPERWAPNRVEACHLLALCGSQMLPTLKQALADRDPAVQEVALGLAGCLGSAAAPAAPQVIALLGDPDKSIRELAARTLGNMGVRPVNPIFPRAGCY